MNKLKPLDCKILSELMKDARISDRQMAKILGVSQPTVSRRRVALEREVIDGYTAIPKWEWLALWCHFTKTIQTSKSSFLGITAHWVIS